MKSVLVLLMSALFIAQTAPGFAADFRNEVTPKHVLVPGMGAYFIPAEGLTLSKRFDGFESAERRIEVVVARVKAPFARIDEGFTEENLKTRGVEMRSKNPLSINGATASIIKALHPDAGANWAKWILLVADGDATLVVNGVFVGGDEAAAREVETMLKSLAIRHAAPPERPNEEPDGR